MSGFLTKIAHNNRVSLGPKDLRTLADVLSTEKRLIEATNKVASERIRSSLAIKEWGAAEGADLGDTLSCMSQLFELLSGAETTFAEHNTEYRLHFKSIRKMEEYLADLRATQKTLAGKIDAQERRVSKMKEENKDLPNAAQKLHEMKQEMIGLENNVMNEEARLGDFKRTTTRDALSLKLGALLELGEKMIIIAEIGKLVVAEIPTAATEPGTPRAAYHSFDRTHTHMDEVRRCLSEVVFNGAPLESTLDPPHAPPTPPNQYPPPQQNYDPYLQSPGGNNYDSGTGFSQQSYDNRGYPEPGRYEHDTVESSQHQYQPQTPSDNMRLPEIEEASPIMSRGEFDSDSPRFAAAETHPASHFLPPGAGLGVGPGHADGNRSSLAYVQDEEDEVPDEGEEQRRLEEEWAAEAEQARTGPPTGTGDQEPSDSDNFGSNRNTMATSGSNATISPSAGFELPPVQHMYSEDSSDIPHRHQREPQSYQPQPPYQQPSYAITQQEPPLPLQPVSSTDSPSSPSQSNRTTRPIVIRGESALGSKHGDVFVPGSVGAVPPIGSATPFFGAGGSGYNQGADTSSVSSGDRSKVLAGAFRRPRVPQYSLPPANDGKYPILSASFSGPTHSEANRIRDEYLAQSGNPGPDRPTFDVSPLHVARKGPPRSGSVPNYSTTGVYPSVDEVSSGPAIQTEEWRQLEQPRGSSKNGHISQVTPPSHQAHAPASYATPSSPGGFSAAQFVTRLD